MILSFSKRILVEFRLSAPYKHARSFNDLRLVFRLIDLNGDEKRKPDGFFSSRYDELCVSCVDFRVKTCDMCQ